MNEGANVEPHLARASDGFAFLNSVSAQLQGQSLCCLQFQVMRKLSERNVNTLILHLDHSQDSESCRRGF